MSGCDDDDEMLRAAVTRVMCEKYSIKAHPVKSHWVKQCLFFFCFIRSSSFTSHHFPSFAVAVTCFSSCLYSTIQPEYIAQ